MRGAPLVAVAGGGRDAGGLEELSCESGVAAGALLVPVALRIRGGGVAAEEGGGGELRVGGAGRDGVAVGEDGGGGDGPAGAAHELVRRGVQLYGAAHPRRHVLGVGPAEGGRRRLGGEEHGGVPFRAHLRGVEDAGNEGWEVVVCKALLRCGRG